MAISFEESLRKAREAAKKASQAAEPEEVVEEATEGSTPVMFAMKRVMTADETVSEWTLDDSKYRYYPEYSDDNISEIDGDKNVALNEKQINLTQEKNSQFVPFRMPRYYDGFDLATAILNIRFVNIEGGAGYSQPINVYYSADWIKFGWLIDGQATAIAGELDFEIQAIGKNSGGDDYVWKTKPCKNMNILQSLEGNGVIEPDNSWAAGFLTEVTEKVAEAQVLAADAWSAAEAAEGSKAEAAESAAAAKESADAAQEIIDTAKIHLELSVDDAVNAAVEGAFADYYNKIEVDELLANIDVTEELDALKEELTEQIESIDGLAAFNVEYDGTNLVFYNGEDEIKSIEIHSEPSAEWTTAFRETLDADIAEKKVTYDIELIPPEDSTGKNKFTLQEIYKEGQIDEVRIPKTTVYFAAGGGSGGGTSDYGLRINLVTAQAFSITMEGDAKIIYRFSGTDSTGDPVPLGYYSWILGSTTLATGTVYSGVNTTFDATPHLKVGTNTLRLLINDDNGQSVSKTYTIQKIDLRMESTFRDNVTQPMGDVVFSYTPYGAVEKDIHFLLDGEEINKITTKASGTQMTYSIPAQEHGAHLLDIYSTALVGATIVESNHIVRDILWYDPSTGIPVIGCTQQNFEMRQYDTVNLNYVVYDPSTETPTVTLAVDGRTISTLTLEKSENIWQFKSTEIGKHELTITCGDTVKTLYATVVELDIDVEPVVAGLAFDFDPSGRSNADANRLWSDGDVAMTVSDNFDWVNGGYQIDDAGDQYFCIKAGTSAEINYKLFADDAKRNGKEFKLIFKTTNVAKPDATFLSCVDNTTGSDHIGIRMDVHEAFVYGQSDNLNLSYSEEDIIEFEFNITKDTEAIPMVMGYEDGVSTRPMVYNIAHNFTQNTPKFITLGSPDCDLHIYRFKVYNTSLTDRGILSNFIADARNAEEMIARYERNQIYDENQMLDPDVLAEKCPWLRVYKISAPYFTNNKSDKVPGTTIQQIYMNGDRILDNWICYNCMHSGRTSTCPLYMETYT